MSAGDDPRDAATPRGFAPSGSADGGFREPLRCREPATATLQLDTEHVRVTRWDFNPGAETGWHRHGWLYVVVPVTDGRLLVELHGGGSVAADLTAGVAYTRDAGVEHNVINDGERPLAFVEVEVKAHPG
jgi:quercetin dioxygenase-like cupin family protein